MSNDPAPDDWLFQVTGLGDAGGYDSWYFGGEFYFGAVGGGLTWVGCCNERGKTVTMLFRKICFGKALGGSVGAGRVLRVSEGHVKQYEGEDCKPENYSGYFAEVGFTAGFIGAGADIGTGETDTLIPLPIPWETSGTVEWGPSVAPKVGWSVKRVFCYYRPIGGPAVDESSCCTKSRQRSPIFAK